MQSESARMTTAKQARFRINHPNSKPRSVKVVALDARSEAVVKRLALGQWQNASFLIAKPFDGAPRSGTGWNMRDWLSDLAGRTKENLVSTDNGIIMARHRLMRAAKALVEKGTIPPGVDPEHHRVRSVSIVLPPDQAFKDGAKEALVSRLGAPQTTV